MSQVRVTVEGLEAAERRLQATPHHITGALDATAVALEGLVEAGAGRHAKTGALERSIFKARVTGGWEIGHDSRVAPHARFVHDGTRPHVIVPNKRKSLRWPVPWRPGVLPSDRGPGFAFAKRVDRPGYRGDAWLRRAAREALPIFERVLNARMKGV